ncbi:hypothetical protein R6Q59_030436 [Mikania micrantha]
MEHARVTTLAGLEIIQHRGFDRAVIERLGRLEEFDSMLTPPWVYLLRCRWPQYAELTVEFHSTFQYDARSVTTPGAVAFALGRTAHSMIVADFAVAMGIYTREEVTARAFEDLLLGVSRAARPGHATEYEMAAFWSTIAIPPHTDRRLATHIRDPLLRYIHRILTSTLIPRHSGKDKVPILADPPGPVPPVPPPSTHRILHQRERPPHDVPPRPPAAPRLTQRYLLQRLDTLEDNQRRIAAHLAVELAPRMPDPRPPASDHEPGSDTDLEDKEEYEEEDDE